MPRSGTRPWALPAAASAVLEQAGAVYLWPRFLQASVHLQLCRRSRRSASQSRLVTTWRHRSNSLQRLAPCARGCVIRGLCRPFRRLAQACCVVCECVAWCVWNSCQRAARTQKRRSMWCGCRVCPCTALWPHERVHLADVRSLTRHHALTNRKDAGHRCVRCSRQHVPSGTRSVGCRFCVSSSLHIGCGACRCCGNVPCRRWSGRDCGSCPRGYGCGRTSACRAPGRSGRTSACS